MSTLKPHWFGHESGILLKLGLPIMVSQVGMIVVTFADTMMVGAYATEALAAAAFVNSVFMVPTVMLIGFAAGLTPLIGLLFSQQKYSEAGMMYRSGLWLNLLVALCLIGAMVALYFFIPYMGQPPEIIPLIKEYFLVVLASLVPMSLFCASQQMANGITDTQLPMWISLGCNAINIFGNWLLIFGHFGLPELGLVGAGYATFAARLFGCVAIIAAISLQRKYRAYRQGVTILPKDGALYKKVWVTSYPVMTQSGIECLSFSFGGVMCGWFGTIQLAAYQVLVAISQLGYMTFLSFAIATSIRVSNLVGVDDITGMRRVTLCGLFLNFVMATVACAIFFFADTFMLGLFTEDTDVIAYGLLLIPPLILYQYADSTQCTYANALRGTANVKPLLWISFVAYIIIGIPVMYLFGITFQGESVGVFYSFTVSLGCAAVLLSSAFYRTIRQFQANLSQAKEIQPES